MNIRKIIGTRVNTIVASMDTGMKTDLTMSTSITIMKRRIVISSSMCMIMNMTTLGGMGIRTIFPVAVAPVRDMARLQNLLWRRDTRKDTLFFISTAWIVPSRKTTSGKSLRG